MLVFDLTSYIEFMSRCYLKDYEIHLNLTLGGYNRVSVHVCLSLFPRSRRGDGGPYPLVWSY